MGKIDFSIGQPEPVPEEKTILVNVKGRHASAVYRDLITSGSRGIYASFTFDAAWDDLTKIAVFEGSERKIDVELTGESCEVPPEVMEMPKSYLRIGVYGVDGTGGTVIPTVYASVRRIEQGTDPSGEHPAEKTKTLVEKLMEAAQAARDAADEAERLAKSVKDAADAGEFDGEDGNGIWWTVSWITSTGVPGYGEIRASYLKGRSGTPAAHDLVIGPAIGDSGSIAELYEISSVATGTCALKDIGSLKGAHGDPGADGYAPEVTIEQIDGGYRVTITSADYPEGQSFDVMNGQGGGGGITVDDEISATSENPVQNKVIKAALDEKANASDVPTKTSNLTNDSGFITASGAAAAAPVQSVNGQTGRVSLSIPSTAKDVGALPSSTLYAGASTQGGAANKAVSIPMGHLDSTSTATVMTATIPGITELRDGVCVWLENGVIASASGVTLNINSLGAKPIYNSLSGEIVTTTFTAASTYLFVYNSTRVTGGCWDMVYGYDANTTYTPPKLGFGYGTCSTAEATAAKTAALSSYTLTTGGIVAVKFTNAVPAGATLNINSKGAKAIYYKGAAITDGVIKAGDTATFVYSTYYHLISIDRSESSEKPDWNAAPGTAAEILNKPTEVSAFTNDAEYLTESTAIASADNWLGDALANVDAEQYVLFVASGTSGAAVTHYRGLVQTMQTVLSAKKLVCAFGIPKSASPSQLTDFDILAVVDARNVNLSTYQIEFAGISGGKLYSTVLSPSGSNQMTGTLTVTDLALSSAQGVSF